MANVKKALYGLLSSTERFMTEAKSRARKLEEIQHVKKLADAAILTAEQKQSIQAIWGGLKTDSTFWAFYTERTGVFDAKYVPDDLYYTSIDAFYNDSKGFQFIDNKCYYDMYFPEVRRPKTVAKRVNGFWLDDDRIVSEDAVYQLAKCHHVLFLKEATDSMGGHGVSRLVMQDLDKDSFHDCIAGNTGDLIIQEAIIQHDVLSSIHPKSVNTIRIMTWLASSGELVVLSKVLRTGIGESYLDNASSGGIVVGIDENNCLKEYAYTSSGAKYDRHPTTGVSFKGFELPGIDKAVELTKLHTRFPHYRLISWDIAIDQSGYAVLIEFNIHHGQLDFHQLCNGPLFGDRTEEMISEVFKNHQ